MANPDWQALINQCFGPGTALENSDCSPQILWLASNVVIGTNPPYTVQDFLAIFPKFGGVPLLLSGTATVSGSAQVTIQSGAGISPGNLVYGPGIPDGTIVTSIAGNTLTLSQEATATGSVNLSVINNPPIPIAALTAFVYLATSSLVQARWLEQWTYAMALYIAHYATLYARSDGNPNSTVGQIAAQGIATGIQVSKSVGDVSVGYQPVPGLDNWGAWNLTVYGQQLATLAKVIGSGPMLVY